MSSPPGVPLPADIARRQFATTRKGYDPNEVRAYLTGIASLVEELEATATAQRERAEQAEAQFEHVEQLDEGRMVELLGKETVRVLEAARVAAADIRRKAEEAASRLISEANEEAHRVRAEAEAAMAAQRIELRAEAEAMQRQAASELARRRAEGEELVAEMRREAESECESLRTRAQEEGRQMVTEAQVVRERMLRDLARRRRASREQLERLNAARDRLLAAYEVVRRTVDAATGELAVALPEAKVAGEAAMRRVHGEPEPSVEELDDLVAMARIAGFLDPRLEESILDEAAEPVAGNGSVSAPGAGARRPDSDAPAGPPTTLPEAVQDRAAANGGLARARGPEPEGQPPAASVSDVVDVVAVEATVVDAADAVDALRELVDDESSDDDLVQGLDADPLESFDAPDPDDVEESSAGTEAGPAVEEDDAAGPDRHDSVAASLDARLFPLGADHQDEDPYEVVPRLATTGRRDDLAHERFAAQAEVDHEHALHDEPEDVAAPASTAPAADHRVGGGDPFDVEGLDEEEDPRVAGGDTFGVGDLDDEDHDQRVAGGEAYEPPQTPSVDELFAQLRAGRQQEQTDETAAGVVPDLEPEGQPIAEVEASLAGAGAPAQAEAVEARSLDDRGFTRAGGPEPEPQAQAEEQPEAVDEEQAEAEHDELLLRQRDETLVAIEQTLSRRLKRVLADDQNEVLDLLRRVKGAEVDLDEELPPVEDEVVRYAAAARDDLGQAATAGAVQVAAVAGFDGDCDDLAMALAETVAAPLRERVARSFAEAGSDVEELTGRLRSLFREWKAQRVGDAVRHFTVAAYAQGAYGAVPEGTPLRWLVDRTSDACPDADDNALAGAVPKGDSFPTGDRHPPAHPGCRCLVAPADQLVEVSSNRSSRAPAGS